MPLRPGDRVSISLSPTIALAKYVNLKPHATVTRDVPEGVDPEVFAAELVADVRQECYRALAVDLDIMNELSQAIADGIDLSDILKDKIRHAPAHQVVEAASAPGPRRKTRS